MLGGQGFQLYLKQYAVVTVFAACCERVSW